MLKIKLNEKVKSPYGSCPYCGTLINGEEFIKTATENKLIGPCPNCGRKVRYYIINPHIFMKVKN